MQICLLFHASSLMLTHTNVAVLNEKITHTFSPVLLKHTCASSRCTCACLPRLMESTLRPQCKYYLARAPVCSSDGATVVSEPSSAPGSSRACSSAPPCAPSPATQPCRERGDGQQPQGRRSVTLLTICVRWCSLPRMLCPVATSSSNSSNFCSICMSSSAATGLRPSVPGCRAVSEKMRDLVSSVHELIRGEEGRGIRWWRREETGL